jgi:hypothetical protein
MRIKTSFLLSGLLLIPALKVQAFCGFYVAKAGSSLYNEKSEVIMVRDGLRNVITMSNDFKGSAKDFAMVVPVPVVLKESDIRVIERGLFDRWDAYSAPRLVEYFDHNPCQQNLVEVVSSVRRITAKETSVRNVEEDESFGVKIEARYSIGEYDIMVLSAEQSGGLKDWLIQNGYAVPPSAEEVLMPYIRSGMKFFVVKVNLKQLQQTGFNYLRPIQIKFESERFMLPIRLGMANSQGEQDLIVYAITRNGSVECSNYRTVDLPTGNKIPTFIKQDFGSFYKDLFAKEHRRQGSNAVFTEYAWNVSPNWGGMKCDPCVGLPPNYADLIESGADWLQTDPRAFFTRLHVRYGREKFPQDLFFTQTANTQNRQARYVITWPAQGPMECSEAKQYLESLPGRRSLELQELAMLTGWNTDAYQGYIKDGKAPKANNGKEGSFPILYAPDRGDNGNGGGWRWLLAMSVLALGLLFAGMRKHASQVPVS